MIADPSGARVGETVPQVAGHGVPFCASDQLSCPAVESDVTLPLNCWVTFNGMSALTGVTSTVIPATVMVAEPCTDGALTELAVRVTVRSARTGLAGAV